jgi:hypothetical protein
MAFQTAAEAASKMAEWFKRHPSVAETDSNLNALIQFIKANFALAGEVVIDDAYLDMAYASIGGSLQHLAGPEIQQQIALVNQQAKQVQAQLDAERAERDRKAAQLLRDQTRQQIQDNRGPGAASAYSGAEDRAAKEVADRKAAQNAAVLNRQRSEMAEELRAIDQFQVYRNGLISWGSTWDQRKAKKANLRSKYPQFAGEIKD